MDEMDGTPGESLVEETIPASMFVPKFLGKGEIDWTAKPVPEPGEGEILVRVAANAMCGTDRLQHRFGSPVVPGHEAAGTVVAAGPGTTTPTGTPGVVYLMGYCGRCRSCRARHTNQCLAKTCDMGFTQDGGYCRYERVREPLFFPVARDLPLDEATLLLDVMGTSGHAIERARLVRKDIESVLVAGAGPIGLGIVAMARLLLGEEIPLFVFDRAGYRLRLAQRLGAIAIDMEKQDVAAALRDHGIDAADAVFDAAGRREARDRLIQCAAKRSVLVCVGHGEDVALDVSSQLIAPERAVLGSEYFRYDELPANLERLKEHREYLAGIITHRLPLEELPDAFAAFNACETGKVVIQP